MWYWCRGSSIWLWEQSTERITCSGCVNSPIERKYGKYLRYPYLRPWPTRSSTWRKEEYRETCILCIYTLRRWKSDSDAVYPTKERILTDSSLDSWSNEQRDLNRRGSLNEIYDDTLRNRDDDTISREVLFQRGLRVVLSSQSADTQRKNGFQLNLLLSRTVGRYLERNKARDASHHIHSTQSGYNDRAAWIPGECQLALWRD